MTVCKVMQKRLKAQILGMKRHFEKCRVCTLRVGVLKQKEAKG